jgi:hypothetical protein
MPIIGDSDLSIHIHSVVVITIVSRLEKKNKLGRKPAESGNSALDLLLTVLTVLLSTYMAGLHRLPLLPSFLGGGLQ